MLFEDDFIDELFNIFFGQHMKKRFAWGIRQAFGVWAIERGYRTDKPIFDQCSTYVETR